MRLLSGGTFMTHTYMTHTCMTLFQAVERRYILSSEQRDRAAKTGHRFPQELGGDWSKLLMFLSQTLANQVKVLLILLES